MHAGCHQIAVNKIEREQTILIIILMSISIKTKSKAFVTFTVVCKEAEGNSTSCQHEALKLKRLKQIVMITKRGVHNLLLATMVIHTGIL
jgi:hypothetical protein